MVVSLTNSFPWHCVYDSAVAVRVCTQERSCCNMVFSPVLFLTLCRKDQVISTQKKCVSLSKRHIDAHGHSCMWCGTVLLWVTCAVTRPPNLERMTSPARARSDWVRKVCSLQPPFTTIPTWSLSPYTTSTCPLYLPYTTITTCSQYPPYTTTSLCSPFFADRLCP